VSDGFPTCNADETYSPELQAVHIDQRLLSRLHELQHPFETLSTAPRFATRRAVVVDDALNDPVLQLARQPVGVDSLAFDSGFGAAPVVADPAVGGARRQVPLRPVRCGGIFTRYGYVRQLRDWKGAANVETMTPKSMAVYARLCGGTVARAHARSGDRIAIASYLGNSTAFDVAIAAFSEAYADQNERDYAALVQAEKDGRIVAQRGL
jgi:hypothetical protein